MNGIAVMGLDPGGTSGCAQGVFRADAKSTREALARAIAKQQLISWEEKGHPVQQAWAIANRWSSFQFKCNVEYGIDVRDIHFVIEGFNLRQLAVDLAPVKVTYGVLTLLYKLPKRMERETDRKKTDHVPQHDRTANPDQTDAPTFVEWPLGRPIFQTAGDAKHYATNQRLRDWGVWVVGSTHRRDAVRHVCAKLSAEL
jgi:hypothetical protein